MGLIAGLVMAALIAERAKRRDGQGKDFRMRARSQSYVISRLEAHADLRVSQALQVFIQFDSG